MAGERIPAYLATCSYEEHKSLISLPCMLLPLLLLLTPAGATDRLVAGQFLTGTLTIVSDGGVFELGFFQPGQSGRYYLGIWYKKSVDTVVWVANRERPVYNPSASQFGISEDGCLLVLHEDTKTIWFSSDLSAVHCNSSFAVLEDTGNLILKRGAKASSPVWQSFDYLTDTWLPGSSLGRNKVTGELKKLVSWKTYDDPAPGLFSFHMERMQLILTLKGSRAYWSSGSLKGQAFELIPKFTDLIDLSISDDLVWESVTLINHAIVSLRFVLGANGQIRMEKWINITEYSYWNLIWAQPGEQSNFYSDCGPFGVWDMYPLSCRCLNGFTPVSLSDWGRGKWSAGCAMKTTLDCSRRKQDMFEAVPSVLLPSNPQRNLSRGTSENCRYECLNMNGSQCSCTAYAFEDGFCLIFVGALDLKQMAYKNIGSTLHIRLGVPDVPVTTMNGGNRGSTLLKAIGPPTGVILLIFIGISVYWAWRRERQAQILLQQLLEGSLVMFPYRLLQSATRNFSDKLGEGGFGSVFRGVLPDTTVVAVKKLKLMHQHGAEKQFRAEVSTLGKAQHVNLVRLRGFCCNGLNDRLLVYDFMPNGSLTDHLFRPEPVAMCWDTRYRIMIGVARGLAYLHDECRDGSIVHCDIKPENILLDADFNPKVADFGMAKLIGRDFSRALTTMRGTRGYLAPEWISGLPITIKADVYSYGMMLLEMVSGKRNSSNFPAGDADIYWPAWAATRVSQGQTLELVDDRLQGVFHTEELERACRTACWCIQDYEGNRPSMGMVVQMLERTVDVGVPPVPESLHHLMADDKAIMYFTESSLLFYSHGTENCKDQCI